MYDRKEYTTHDTVERKRQHLSFYQHKCFLHAKVPRVKQSDGKIKTQEVPWARLGSGFTLLFDPFSVLQIESEVPVSKAADVVQVNLKRLWTVFNHWMGKPHQEDKVEQLEAIGFDETSVKKGHNYVTIAVDLDKRRVLYVSPGKVADCIAKSKTYLEEKAWIQGLQTRFV